MTVWKWKIGWCPRTSYNPYKSRVKDCHFKINVDEKEVDKRNFRHVGGLILERRRKYNKKKVNSNKFFKEIVGLEDAKRALLNSVVRPAIRPDLFPLGWSRGILMFGPPGTGKTLLASSVARKMKCNFREVDASSINSKWCGEAAKNVGDLFQGAKEWIKDSVVKKKAVPCIIFIDEVDALFSVGNEWNVEMKNQFLKEMDSMEDKNKNIPLYLIGATNKPWNIDPSFIRRFQKRIYIPLPDLNQRKGILKLYLSKINVENNLDVSLLADCFEGYSGSDIREICQVAHLKTIERLFDESENPRRDPDPVMFEDFEEIIDERKPSVSLETIEKCKNWADRYTAI